MNTETNPVKIVLLYSWKWYCVFILTVASSNHVLVASCTIFAEEKVNF